MNTVVLVGRLTKDPEQQLTPNGIPVCRFRIAVDRNFTNSQGEREADFINIVTWRALAENCFKYLQKGRLVGVKGRIEVSQFEKDGVQRTWTDIVADEVKFLSPPPDKQDGGHFDDEAPAKAKPSGKAKLVPVEDDELPF